MYIEDLFSLLNKHPFSIRFCQSIAQAVECACRRRSLGLRTRESRKRTSLLAENHQVGRGWPPIPDGNLRFA
jgi:hypothetical protein